MEATKEQIVKEKKTVVERFEGASLEGSRYVSDSSGLFYEGFVVLIGNSEYGKLAKDQSIKVSLSEDVECVITHYFYSREIHHGLSSVDTEYFILAVQKKDEKIIEERSVEFFHLYEDPDGTFTLDFLKGEHKHGPFEDWKIVSLRFNLEGMVSKPKEYDPQELANLSSRRFFLQKQVMLRAQDEERRATHQRRRGYK